MSPVPIPYQWDGEAMAPASTYRRRCDQEFVIGEFYHLVPHEDRSPASHAHYFASITEAWRNLPEALTEQFPTTEHLRKNALIRAGYADERSIVCASKAEALRVAAFIKPMDDYAVVVVSEAVVKVFTAKSQSMRAMGKVQFQASKEAVLNVLADMVGATSGQLQQNAREVA